MILTRRQFGKRSLATVATLALASSIPVSFTGCTVDIKGLLNTVLEEAKAIAAQAEAGASWLAPFQTVIGQLETAIASWENGGAIADVEEVLNDLVAAAGVIPETALYAPLAALLVAAVEAVLNYFVPVPTTAVAAARKANVYVGRVSLQKPHFGQSQVAAAKEQFNSQAKMLGLTAAVIK